MIDVVVRELPSGAEHVAAFAGVPRAGDWLEGEAGILAVDVVLYRAGGAVLVAAHAVGAAQVAERLDPPVAKADEAFTLKA